MKADPMRLASAILLAAAFSQAGACAAAPAPAPVPRAATPVTTGEQVTLPGVGRTFIYRPAGPSRGLVLFLSGDGGWNLGVVDMANILAAQGVTVAGISVPAYLKAAEASPAACIDAGADLLAAGRALTQRLGLPPQAPIVAGYSSGATIAYAAMAQAAPGSFRGGLSMGFGADQAGVKPWCRGAGLSGERITRPEHGWLFAPTRLGAPWLVLQGLSDQVVSPTETRAFAGRVPDAQLIELPKVGHGFSVERNWVPQFQAAFTRLLAARPAPPARAR